MGKERNYNDFRYSLKLSDKFVLCLKLIKVDDKIKAKLVYLNEKITVTKRQVM